MKQEKTKALKAPARDKMLKRPSRDTQQKVDCTKGHEGQCESADPKNAGDCDCRCLGQNHGKSHGKVRVSTPRNGRR